MMNNRRCRAQRVREFRHDPQPQQAPITTLSDLILRIPKTDLHLHLDGSIRLSTIAELGSARRHLAACYTAEGLDELVFKSHYRNLEEYLTTFGYSCAVMQNPENIERIAYELAIDNQREGVRYIEVRRTTAPYNKHMDMGRVLESVNGACIGRKKSLISIPRSKMVPSRRLSTESSSAQCATLMAIFSGILCQSRQRPSTLR